jgi:ribosomal-protein-alanine N-acetyltransferase
MKAVLDFASVNLGIKKLAARCAKENIASSKVIEKLGFVYERNDVMHHVDKKKHFDSRVYFLDLG